MKFKKRIFLTLTSCLLLFDQTFAQDKKVHNMGPVATFIGNLKKVKGTNPVLYLPVADGKLLQGKNNVNRKEGSETLLIGSIDNSPNSTFTLYYTEEEVRGELILLDKKLAYEYYTEKGNSMVKEVDINKRLCIDYAKPEKKKEKDKEKEKGQSGKPPVILAAPPAGDPVYDLQSFPGAQALVMLDFDGETVVGSTWDGGSTINAAASSFTSSEIQEIWELVSEDFRPFSLNITTSDAVYAAYPYNRKIKVVFTPTNYFRPNVGGVAYVNSFSENNNTHKPCWVFVTGAKYGGEAASHEIGHTLGLSHDGRTSPLEVYFKGHGNWAPIMGESYYKDITQWSYGEYANANNNEDDLFIISRTTIPNNGFTYRADEDATTLSTGRWLSIDVAGNVSPAANNGVITSFLDLDFFKFTVTKGSACTLTVSPNAVHPNLDILVKFYDGNGNLMQSASTPGQLGSPIIITDLLPGAYHFTVEGTGDGDPATNGYSKFCSLGSYFISGTITPICATVNIPTIVGNAMVCAGGPNEPYNIPIGTTRGATYSWAASNPSMGTFPSGNTGLSTIVDHVNSAGEYSISATANNGCGQTATGYLNISIASGMPSTPPTPLGASPACNSGANSTYTIGGMASGLTYEITPTNAVASSTTSMYGQLSVDWNNSFIGTASIRVKKTNGCGTSGWSSYKTVNVTSGVCRMAFLEEENSLSSNEWTAELYPNPSAKEANLFINHPWIEKATIEILDTKGTVVDSYTEVLTGSLFTFGSTLPVGVYAIKIYSGESQKIVKFVKQ